MKRLFTTAGIATKNGRTRIIRANNAAIALNLLTKGYTDVNLIWLSEPLSTEDIPFYLKEHTDFQYALAQSTIDECLFKNILNNC